MSKTKEALDMALDALESQRVMSKDTHGNYTIEITPAKILCAIAAIREALAEQEAEHCEGLADNLPVCAEDRPCTCHPDDSPPKPCAGRYAASECLRRDSQHIPINPAMCIRPACGETCTECNSAISPADVNRYAIRYAYLRERNLDAIVQGGVFAGKVPDNIVLNGVDLDDEIDNQIANTKGY